METQRDQRLVDSIAQELIAARRLVFLLDHANKEMFLQVGKDEEVLGKGMVGIYPPDLAEFEEVLEPVEQKVRWLRADTLGRIIAAGAGKKRTGSDERTGLHEVSLTIPLEADGRTILERTASAVILARIYDLLNRDAEPLIHEAPEPDR